MSHIDTYGWEHTKNGVYIEYIVYSYYIDSVLRYNLINPICPNSSTRVS